MAANLVFRSGRLCCWCEKGGRSVPIEANALSFTCSCRAYRSDNSFRNGRHICLADLAGRPAGPGCWPSAGAMAPSPRCSCCTPSTAGACTRRRWAVPARVHHTSTRCPESYCRAITRDRFARRQTFFAAEKTRRRANRLKLNGTSSALKLEGSRPIGVENGIENAPPGERISVLE